MPQATGTAKLKRTTAPAGTHLLCRLLSLVMALLFAVPGHTQTPAIRSVTGVVVAATDERVPGITIVVDTPSSKTTTTTDAAGSFHLVVASGPMTLKVVGDYVVSNELRLDFSDNTEDLQLRIGYAVPPVRESLVISATALNPTIDQRNSAVYKNTLFSRDDQIFDTLAAGINTGRGIGISRSS